MATTSTTTTSTWLQPQWQDYLTNLQNAVNSSDFSPYKGQTVAGFSPDQQSAFDMQNQFTQNGTGYGNAARTASTSLANGTYNPYAGAINPLAASGNPFTSQVVNNTNNSMTDAYRRGTGAQLDSSAARAGSFGGSGYQQQLAANQRGLADSIGSTDANLYQSDYNNRMAQMSTDASRNQAATLGGIQGGYAGEAGDQNAINGLLNTGKLQQGQQQQLLDAMKGYYTDTQSAPYVGLDIMRGGLGAANGAQSTTSQSQPDTNWILSALAGMGLVFGPH